MAPKLWLCGGKIIATADGKPRLCENDPCDGVLTTCCPGVSLPTTLTFGWLTAIVGGGSVAGLEIEIVHNGSQWVGSYTDQGACAEEVSVAFYCNEDDQWEVDLDGTIYSVGGTCEPLMLTQLAMGGPCSEIQDVYITE